MSSEATVSSPPAQASKRSGNLESGTIKFYDHQKRYGIISPDGAEQPEVYFSLTVVTRDVRFKRGYAVKFVSMKYPDGRFNATMVVSA